VRIRTIRRVVESSPLPPTKRNDGATGSVENAMETAANPVMT
jgi:hypothetical protein